MYGLAPSYSMHCLSPYVSNHPLRSSPTDSMYRKSTRCGKAALYIILKFNDLPIKLRYGNIVFLKNVAYHMLYILSISFVAIFSMSNHTVVLRFYLNFFF